MPIKSFKPLWAKEHDPTVDGGMIDNDAALGHHLFQIS
jgi:hypothetical protein